jgi:hypothetical protein
MPFRLPPVTKRAGTVSAFLIVSVWVTVGPSFSLPGAISVLVSVLARGRRAVHSAGVEIMVTHNPLRGPDERVFRPAVRRHVDIALGFQERRSIQSMPAECQSFIRCDQISRLNRERIRLIAAGVERRLNESKSA